MIRRISHDGAVGESTSQTIRPVKKHHRTLLQLFLLSNSCSYGDCARPQFPWTIRSTCVALRGGDIHKNRDQKNVPSFWRKNSATRSSRIIPDDFDDEWSDPLDRSEEVDKENIIPLPSPSPSQVDLRGDHSMINNKRSLSSLVPGLVLALKKQITPQRFLTLTRFSIAYFLCVEIWKQFGVIWEEWMEELEQQGGGSSSASSFKEDHDLPLFKEDGIIQRGLAKNRTLDNTLSPSTKQSPKKQKEAAAEGYAKDIAQRLHAAGIPYSSQVQPQPSPTNDSSTTPPQNKKTVEQVLKSLTKLEGQILSNTLLSPLDYSRNKINIHDNPWENIGGLETVKENLLDLLYPLLTSPDHHPNTAKAFAQYGSLLSSPPGLLLYGPPGCGKTLLARALAHTANIRFLCVNPSTLLRKYVGETNLHVRALFSLAKKISPAILFVDEMDGLFRERGSLQGGGEEHDVSRDLKTEFMSLWDGIHSSVEEGNNKVLVMGATNRPFDIDSAFLRRMPRSFFVGLPDLGGRMEILRILLRGVPLDGVGGDPNANSFFRVDKVAEWLEGYSPSDIKEVLRTAALIPLREARMSQVANQRDEGLPMLRSLTLRDVWEAKLKVPPTQWSKIYKTKLAEYAMRERSGMAPYEESGMGMGGGDLVENESDTEGEHSFEESEQDDGYYEEETEDHDSSSGSEGYEE